MDDIYRFKLCQFFFFFKETTWHFLAQFPPGKITHQMNCIYILMQLWTNQMNPDHHGCDLMNLYVATLKTGTLDLLLLNCPQAP